MTGPLTASDVRAMLLGGGPPPPSSASPPRTPSAEPRAISYGTCDRCNVRTSGLFTWLGSAEWQTGAHDHARMVANIKQLRHDTDRRTVLICDRCMYEIDGRADELPPLLKDEATQWECPTASIAERVPQPRSRRNSRAVSKTCPVTSVAELPF